MILRDPVHGLVSFEGDDELVVSALLRARELQRLRRIRHLGVASLVFPGGEHSRFAHALGAACVMTRLLARVSAVQNDLPVESRIQPWSRRDAVAAALLHDVGHGPLSHLFEQAMPSARHHEEWTLQIIRDPSTEVHGALAAIDYDMPERVAGLLEGRHPVSWLPRTVSGELDVDRCDYLLRDSHMTGVRYGIFDLDWLLRALRFGQVSGQTVLAIEGRKGLPAIEGFFLARHYMYQQVYHHKATQAAQCLIASMFRRVAELVRTVGSVPGLTPALANSARGVGISLAEFLTLDDPNLYAAFAAWERSEDAILRTLAGSLLARRLPKSIPLPEAPERRGEWETIFSIAQDTVRKLGHDPEYAVWLDVAGDTPYAEPDDDSADGIYVLLRHRAPIRLGSISFILGQLRNQRIVRGRLVVREDVRDAVVHACAERLRG